MLGSLVASGTWVLTLVAEPVPEPPRPASYELEWIAPEACPTADSIRARIEALVPETEGGEGVMLVRGEVEATAGGFALTLATEYLGSESSRRVEAQRCDDLGESTALVVAIALQPGLEVAEKTVPEPEPVIAEEPRAEIDRPVAPKTRSVPWRPRSRAVPTDVFTRVALLAEWGSMPRAGGGNALALGLLWPRLRIELVGAYLWPRGAKGPESSAALYQLGSAGARACLRVFAKPTEFPLCLGADAGVLRVDSRGITPPTTLHDLWIAPVVGAGVAVRQRRFGFWSMAELSITARGTRIFVAQTRVWNTAPVSLRFLAGLEIFFSLDRRPQAGP